MCVVCKIINADSAETYEDDLEKEEDAMNEAILDCVTCAPMLAIGCVNCNECNANVLRVNQVYQHVGELVQGEAHANFVGHAELEAAINHFIPYDLI